MPTYANIGGTRKIVGAWYDNIGGSRKQINTMYANVGSASKVIFTSATDYWSLAYNNTGTLSSSTSYSRKSATSVTVNSSGTFTLQSVITTSGRPAAGSFMVSVSNASSTATTGTTLYYFYNSSGSYYVFNTAVSSTSSTAVSRVSSSSYSSDVAYDSTNKRLLIKRSIISSYYRWDKYSTSTKYVETSSGSGSFSLTGDLDANYQVGPFWGASSYSFNSSNGYLTITDSNGEFIDIHNWFPYSLDTYSGYNSISGWGGDVSFNTIYQGLKATSYSENVGIDENGEEYTESYTYKFSYTKKLTSTPSTTSSLSGYVYSPNSSAYTTGSTYKNKTTL